MGGMGMPEMMGYDPSYEPFESEVITSLIRAGTTVIDLGAHTGHYTLLCARYVGSTGKVIAVEPDPSNLTILCRNVWGNGFPHVEILSAAVAESLSIRRLYLDGGTGGDNRLFRREGENRASVLVTCLTLNHIASLVGKIEFIKIDVQGMETEVLRGGVDTFKNNQDMMMLVECSPPDLEACNSNREELIATLFNLGFMVLFVAGGAVRKIFLLTHPSHVRGILQKIGVNERIVVNLLCLRGKYLGIPPSVNSFIEEA